MHQRIQSRVAALAVLAAVAVCAAPAEAGPFGGRGKPVALSDRGAAEIRQAIDERRLVDAGRMIDAASLNGADADARLAVLAGEISLARGRYADAIVAFDRGLQDPGARADAQEGKGLALSLLNRPAEAVALLKSAVAAKPGAWRAWNALGSEYDGRGEWAAAEDAYAQALATSTNPAIVLNNRGYSRLLQNRPTEAAADLVSALQKKPDLAEARTNLRLALAMSGDYDRAVAASSTDDKATLLNNAGFAAAMKGDYAQAEALLSQALGARSQFYARASENLGLAQGLAARQEALADARP